MFLKLLEKLGRKKLILDRGPSHLKHIEQHEMIGRLPAAAVGDAEGLVQVEMAHIGADLGRTLAVRRGGSQGHAGGLAHGLVAVEQLTTHDADGQAGPRLEHGLALGELPQEFLARHVGTGQSVFALAGGSIGLGQGDHCEAPTLGVAFLDDADEFCANAVVETLTSIVFGRTNLAQGQGGAHEDLAVLLAVPPHGLDQEFGHLALVGSVGAGQKACHGGGGVGAHEPVPRGIVFTLLGRIVVVQQEVKLPLPAEHVFVVGAGLFLTFQGGVHVGLQGRQPQGGHGRHLDVPAREVRRSENVHQGLGDVLPQLVVAGPIAEQAHAVAGVGSGADGDFGLADETARGRVVGSQLEQDLEGLVVGQDAQGHGGRLGHTLVAVFQELPDDAFELGLVRAGHVADLGQGDQRGVEDVVGTFVGQGILESRNHRIADHLLRGAQAVLGLILLAVAQEEVVRTGDGLAAVDPGFEVQVGLTVEAPPEVPEGQVGAGR